MNNEPIGAHRPTLDVTSSRLRCNLECVVENVNSGFCNLGYALECADISPRNVFEDRRIYWYLFDNIRDRQVAQLLWVMDVEYHRTGIVKMPPSWYV